MGYFNHPTSGFKRWIIFFLLDFFPPLFYMRDIVSVNDGLVSWFTRISLISAKMLFYIFRTCYDDFIKYHFKLCYIMKVGSGYDDR